MKFDLIEVLDQKSEAMQRQFEKELSVVKERYDDLIVKVKDASNTLS